MGEKNNTYSVLVGNPKGKRPLARPMRRSENDVHMNREERELEGGDWFHLAQTDEKCTHNNDT
jgi:hypothetical protein